MTARAWVLNLDAEDELSRRSRPTPSRTERARMDAMAAMLRDTLVPQGDAVIWPAGEGAARGALGRAWCPTPWALAQLRAAGAAVPRAPSMEVLRAVNHRAWAASLGLTLPRAAWARDRDDLARVMVDPWPAGGWLLKRPLGYAGRGRLHLRARGELDDPRHAGWIANSFADDGLLVEPYVDRVADLGLHGWISPNGALTLGALTAQVCDARGAWVTTARAAQNTLGDKDMDLLNESVEGTAAALWAAGYHGPFGVDAYVWRDERGGARLQPRSEVNARYSMGWAVGMGALRPDLSSP